MLAGVVHYKASCNKQLSLLPPGGGNWEGSEYSPAPVSQLPLVDVSQRERGSLFSCALFGRDDSRFIPDSEGNQGFSALAGLAYA